MSSLLTRRQLIGGAMLAGVGATVFQGLSVNSNPAEAASEAGVDPNFLMGQVVGYDSTSGALNVVDLDLQVRAAQLSSASQVWKQGLWNTNQIALNDCIMSRGQLDQSGTLVIDQLYVDIGSFRGYLEAVTASSVKVAQADGSTIAAAVTSATEVNVAGQTLAGSTRGLVPGQYINLIGYGYPGTGTLVATLIIGPSVDTGLEPQPVIGATGTDCTLITFKHSTTWFCCGNISSACGANCANTGSGSCGNCRADRLQMAWPNLSTTNCDYTCGHSCNNCCRSLRAIGCGGGSPAVYNPCRNTGFFNVTIADCGPCVHCVSPPCDNLDAVTFDMTPCAFTKLGAPLSQGIQACSVTVCV